MTKHFEVAQAVQAAGKALQDRLAVVPAGEAVVLAIADGEGGREGGAEAATQFIKLAKSRTAELTSEAACVQLLLDADALLVGSRHGGETTGLVVVMTQRKTFGASVGDSAAWWMSRHQTEELTAGQNRKPFLGSGTAQPKAFVHHFSFGHLVLATDGLWKYASHENIHERALKQAPESAVQDLVQLVTYASGALPDDVGVIVCRRLKDDKPAVYLTDPAEMRRARLNQPRTTAEQARVQREALHAAAEEFFAEAALRLAGNQGGSKP